MPDATSGPRDVLITGIGLVSSLGEGLDAHWAALTGGTAPVTDIATFAPYVVHPLAKVSFEAQIPKKDQRQMEDWQRIGSYAAGLALDAAGVAGNADILGKTDMVVAAGGGERDFAVDTAILNDLPASNDPGRMLNERLLSDLRPTLSLAQLSNLLAGNISIVHGVTGSSRTFMGEESSGVDAVRIAFARITAGQSDIALVGGSYNAEREDTMVLAELDGYCMKSPFRSVLSAEAPGIPSGSMGAFLVLESAEHAAARGATAIARITGVWSERARRQTAGAITGKVAELLATAGTAGATAILSGASGAPGASPEEAAALSASGLPVRATVNRLGHGCECQFIASIALAALVISKGELFPALPGDPLEKDGSGPVERVIVTGVGQWRGEGAGVVEKV